VAIVVMILGVCIGANTGIFALVNSVLIQPLRYPDSERLVKVRGSRDGEPSNLSPADFFDLQERSETFSSLGAHGWVGFFTVTGDGEPERVAGSNVTFGFFETLGVKPQLGRLFTETEHQSDSASTVLLTHAFWQRRFAGASDVIGRSLRVNSMPHEIVGVLASDYRHPEPNPEREPAIYVPYRFDRARAGRSGRFVRAIGRLEEAATFEQARADLAAIARGLEETYPESNAGRGVLLEPLRNAIVKDSRFALLVLFGAVGTMLLIACANLANLQLVHAAARRHEIGIKTALGAPRGRLVRQLLLESWTLAMAGGAVGLGLALLAKEYLALRVVPRADELAFDGTVVAFTFAVSTLTVLVFGLLPALGMSGGDVRQTIAEGGTRGALGLRFRFRGRQLLIATEVAFSLLLLVSAGLFVRSLTVLEGVAPGFRPERVVTSSLSLPIARYPEGDQIPFYDQLYERVRALPGVRAVGGINILPLTQNYSSDGFQIEDRPVPAGQAPSAEARSVGGDYFEAMGIPLLSGRVFDASDRKESPGVVVVSESMSNRFWPGESPIGKRITYNRGLPEDERVDIGGPGSREIVGIVGDVKHLSLAAREPPMYYTPQPHHPSFHTMTLVVRAEPGTAPAGIAAALRREVHAMDPEIPLYSVRTLDDVLHASASAPRFRAALLGSFATVALVLSLVGVYAVMGVCVAQRTPEIGIRVALGARAGHVTTTLLQETMVPVLVGTAVGLSAAFAVTRFLDSLLYGVSSTDASTFVLVSVLLVSTAGTASLVPTLRALRIDPVRALHLE
jgi:putative ABC transport system permease protein